ncbi:Speckle-type POZ protein B [Aphelenchoides besseyi]|nr:Speckle-type POZ protein B [Aphelenchoides besseyi]
MSASAMKHNFSCAHLFNGQTEFRWCLNDLKDFQSGDQLASLPFALNGSGRQVRCALNLKPKVENDQTAIRIQVLPVQMPIQLTYNLWLENEQHDRFGESEGSMDVEIAAISPIHEIPLVEIANTCFENEKSTVIVCVQIDWKYTKEGPQFIIPIENQLSTSKFNWNLKLKKLESTANFRLWSTKQKWHSKQIRLEPNGPSGSFKLKRSSSQPHDISRFHLCVKIIDPTEKSKTIRVVLWAESVDGQRRSAKREAVSQLLTKLNRCRWNNCATLEELRVVAGEENELVFRCEYSSVSNVPVEPWNLSNGEVESMSELLWRQSFNGQFTDIRFQVENKVFECHKAVVVAQWPRLKDHMREKNTTIEVKNIDPTTFCCLLQWMYLGCVDEFDAEKLFVVAAKKCIPNLKSQSAQSLRVTLNDENAARRLILAVRFDEPKLMKSIRLFIDESASRYKQVMKSMELWELLRSDVKLFYSVFEAINIE